MFNAAVTPPPKGPRGKHRASKSSTGPRSTAEPFPLSNPPNPHYLSHNTNDNSHQQNQHLQYKAFDSSDMPSDSMSASDVPKKKKPHQKGRHKETRSSSTPVVPGDHRPSAAVPANAGQSENLTPQKRVTTPSKAAYAGPTFHASPAPSALPIPSFFSKSVPDAAAQGSVHGRADSFSENIEPSPTRRPAFGLANRPDREESPLDLFFRADREEKARAAMGSNHVSSYSTPQSAGSPAYRGSPSPSPSPASLRRAHPRPLPEPSAGEVFEMDGIGSHDQTYGAGAMRVNERMNAARSKTAPSSMGAPPDDDETQRQAKTQALKDLLLTPQPPRSQLPTPRSDHGPAAVNPAWATTPPAANTRPGHVPHNFHGSPGAWHSVYPIQPLGHLPPRQEGRYGSGNDSPRPVTRSSQLRQEVTITNAAELADAPSLPSSPTAQQSTKREASTVSRTVLAAHIPAEATGKSQPTGSSSKQGTVNIQSMENDLRRMLKLGDGGSLEPEGGNGLNGP